MLFRKHFPWRFIRSHRGFPTRRHIQTHTSYLVDRTLDSNGENCIAIFFTAFKTTVALLEAAMFDIVDLRCDVNGASRVSHQRAPEDKALTGVRQLRGKLTELRHQLPQTASWVLFEPWLPHTFRIIWWQQWQQWWFRLYIFNMFISSISIQT